MHTEEKKQPSAFSVNHILQAAENTMSSERPRETESTNTEDSAEDSNVKITLDEADLWRRFKSLTNEMIVTKNGRWVTRRESSEKLSLWAKLNNLWCFNFQADVSCS